MFGGVFINSRERLMMALNHKQADRVPFDIGSTLITGISLTAYKNLINYIGMTEEDVKTFDIVQQLAAPSECFLQNFGVDMRNVSPNKPQNWNFELYDDGKYEVFKDEFGITWRRPKVSSLYFDMIGHPLSYIEDICDLDKCEFPNIDDNKRYIGIRDKAQKIRDNGYGVVMSSVSAGIFELGGWLRGLENFYMDLASEPLLACTLMDKILEIKLTYWDKVLSEAGDIIDVIQEADDLGAQSSSLISRDMYVKYIKPRHKQLFDFIRSKTEAKIFIHSCGNIRELIPDLIDVGVDILNPIQFNAVNMDATSLKREFGNHLVFWGGGVDTQYILPRSSAQEVKDCVKKQLEILSPDGGFVFNTVHNIQADVPPQNLIAMKEAFDEFFGV